MDNERYKHVLMTDIIVKAKYVYSGGTKHKNVLFFVCLWSSLQSFERDDYVRCFSISVNFVCQMLWTLIDYIVNP